MKKNKTYFEKYLNEFNFGLKEVYAYRSIFLVILYILSQFVILKLKTRGSKLDPELTVMLREITGDESIKVLRIIDYTPNCFSVGNKNLYYNSHTKRILNDEELMALLLHEYGHTKYHHGWKKAFVLGFGGFVGLITLYSMLDNNTGITPAKYFEKPAKAFSTDLILGGIFIHLVNFFYFPVDIKNDIISDSYAEKKGYGGELFSALKKFEKLSKLKLCKSMDDDECEQHLENVDSIRSDPKSRRRLERLMKIYVLNNLNKNSESKYNNNINQINNQLDIYGKDKYENT